MVTNWICLLLMPAFYKKALARESYHYDSVKIQRFSEQYILSHPDYITGRKSNSFPSGQEKGGGGVTILGEICNFRFPILNIGRCFSRKIWEQHNQFQDLDLESNNPILIHGGRIYWRKSFSFKYRKNDLYLRVICYCLLCIKRSLCQDFDCA